MLDCAYDDIQRRWNTDDMIKYFYEPNKVLFLFRKEKYYSMYPKEVTKKYKKVISALPPTHGKVILISIEDIVTTKTMDEISQGIFSISLPSQPVDHAQSQDESKFSIRSFYSLYNYYKDH